MKEDFTLAEGFANEKLLKRLQLYCGGIAVFQSN